MSTGAVIPTSVSHQQHQLQQQQQQQLQQLQPQQQLQPLLQQIQPSQIIKSEINHNQKFMNCSLNNNNNNNNTITINSNIPTSNMIVNSNSNINGHCNNGNNNSVVFQQQVIVRPTPTELLPVLPLEQKRSDNPDKNNHHIGEYFNTTFIIFKCINYAK